MRLLLFSSSLFLLTVGIQHDCGVVGKRNISQITQDVKHFCNVGVSVFRAPLQFHGDDWKKVGPISGSTALLFFADKDIQRFAQSHKSPTDDQLFNFDHYYGIGYTAAMTVGIYSIKSKVCLLARKFNS